MYYELLVAVFRDEVVGVAAWDASATCALPDGAGGLFHGLYVLPLFQRQGIGIRLMDAVFASARQRQLSGLLIKAQWTSRAFFERQGLEALVANDDEYPWQYWKSLG